ncbi:hypothetical protein DPMN_060984 [Dreissena polymorpha]|uniref:Secreted protein n=1 Tax=Dreissena polymorpha TaxID=45954 RepID=A0A9D4C6Y7_DREPO|nr:hypothetical protein DPMN_060984 [Dreissena polymorpha]
MAITHFSLKVTIAVRLAQWLVHVHSLLNLGNPGSIPVHRSFRWGKNNKLLKNLSNHFSMRRCSTVTYTHTEKGIY